MRNNNMFCFYLEKLIGIEKGCKEERCIIFMNCDGLILLELEILIDRHNIPY